MERKRITAEVKPAASGDFETDPPAKKQCRSSYRIFTVVLVWDFITAEINLRESCNWLDASIACT